MVWVDVLANIPGESVDREVHLAEADSLADLFLAEDAQLGAGVLLVLRDEAGALDKAQ